MADGKTLIRFSPHTEGPGPAAFRFTFADLEGQSVEPTSADYVCRYSEQDVWAYARDAIEFEAPPGNYAWCASAGPAWSLAHGDLEVGSGPVDCEVSMTPILDPRAEGLVAGDGHLHSWRGKHKDDFATCFAAEDIDFGGIQYWGLYHGFEHDENPQETGLFRIGGAWASSDEEVEMHAPWCMWEDTTVVGLTEKLPDLREGFGYRMNTCFYRKARELGAKMIVYQSPTWAQFPIDTALGLVDSVNVCDNPLSMGRQVSGPWDYSCLALDDPFQSREFGIAEWVFEHYYRSINAGMRLPMSGGSAYPHGGGGGPVGLNRFYVQTGGSTEPDAYYEHWRAGRTFATNGPLLMATVNGESPSTATIRQTSGPAQLEVRAVCSRPLARLQWVADGQVVAESTCDREEYPCDVTWETELDLGSHQWVAARAFGVSERTLLPAAGRASAPFLTAHTSPFYQDSFKETSPVRQEAIQSILDHIEWMREVVDGRAEAPFAQDIFVQSPLGEAERQEIHGILDEATQAYEATL